VKKVQLPKEVVYSGVLFFILAFFAVFSSVIAPVDEVKSQGCTLPVMPTGLTESVSCTPDLSGELVEVTLDWNDVSGASRYALRIDKGGDSWSGDCANG